MPKAAEKDAPKTEPASVPMKAPVGFQWLYNRLNRQFEMQFDLQPWAFEPHELRLAPLDVARFLHYNSIIKVDLKTRLAEAKCPQCKRWVEVPLQLAGRSPARPV